MIKLTVLFFAFSFSSLLADKMLCQNSESGNECVSLSGDVNKKFGFSIYENERIGLISGAFREWELNKKTGGSYPTKRVFKSFAQDMCQNFQKAKRDNGSISQRQYELLRLYTFRLARKEELLELSKEKNVFFDTRFWIDDLNSYDEIALVSGGEVKTFRKEGFISQPTEIFCVADNLGHPLKLLKFISTVINTKMVHDIKINDEDSARKLAEEAKQLILDGDVKYFNTLLTDSNLTIDRVDLEFAPARIQKVENWTGLSQAAKMGIDCTAINQAKRICYYNTYSYQIPVWAFY